MTQSKRDAGREMKEEGPVWSFGAPFSPRSSRASRCILNHTTSRPLPSHPPETAGSDNGYAGHDVSIQGD